MTDKINGWIRRVSARRDIKVVGLEKMGRPFPFFGKRWREIAFDKEISLAVVPVGDSNIAGFLCYDADYPKITLSNDSRKVLLGLIQSAMQDSEMYLADNLHAINDYVQKQIS